MKNVCDSLVRPKSGMLRPLQLQMSMWRLCTTKEFARLCATQKRQVHVATIGPQNEHVATLRDPVRFFEFDVSTDSTQARYVSTDPTKSVYVLTMFD